MARDTFHDRLIAQRNHAVDQRLWKIEKADAESAQDLGQLCQPKISLFLDFMEIVSEKGLRASCQRVRKPLLSASAK